MDVLFSFVFYSLFTFFFYFPLFLRLQIFFFFILAVISTVTNKMV